MKRKLLLFILLVMLFIPVNAKEEKYKIVSGDLETLGSEICFDTECFYVIGNDGNVLRLLSKYNITVEEKPVQSADAKGIEYADEPYWGKTERKDAKYVYDSNSKLYKYVEAYKDSIIEKGVVVEKARLVNQEELYVGGLDIINYTWHTAKVKFYSNFWSGVAYDDSNVWTSELEQSGYSNPFFGISPVLEIPVGWFGEDSVYVGGINFIKSSDGVISNSDATVDLTFNDLEQEVKYQTIIYNNTDKAVYINDITLKNISEDFINARLDSKSSNMMVEPGGSSLVTFYVRTLKEEGAGRNLNDNITINFRLSDKNLNPGTFSNIFEVFALIVILCGTIYFVRNNKSKKVKTLLLVAVVSILGINFVYADDFINVSVSGKIKYLSQNNIISTGTVLNGKTADYTNSKEVWSYYDKVKNVEVKSIINEPKKYYKKFDLTENKTGRVVGYLVENGDKDTPYDLVIMSNGVVVANSDSSFMFSFPNTEKVDGLSNIDFRGATTMQGMFIGNEKLVSVDTKSIEMDNTTNTSFMFYQCDEIEHDRDDFNLENVNNDDYMIPHSLYNTVKKDAVSDKNEKFDNKVVNTGKYFMKDTKDDKFPIYYYRGDIKNNNVVFGGFCWKIVRTTDTGGVKLIYNGVVKENGSCQMNSDEEMSIGEGFNHWYSYITSSGYMHDDTWFSDDIFGRDYNNYYLLSISELSSTRYYYYSDSYEYKNGKYYLNNPKTYIWTSENYDKLRGMYTCRTSTSCTSLMYVTKNDNGSRSVTYFLNSGESIDDKYLYLASDYEKNGEIFSLKNPIKILYDDWFDSYNDYKGYYVCDNIKDISCSNMYKIKTVSNNSITAYTLINAVFGKDVIYENGVYKLKDTIELIGSDKGKMEGYYYTCGDTNYQCEQIKYVYDFDEYYNVFVFSDGMKFEDFYEKVFVSNEEDSIAKSIIDSWYKDNLINYTDKLEDTIWCNDRSFQFDNPLSGVDNKFNDVIFSGDYRYDNDLISLECKNMSDRFTVSEKNGNGKLTYPIALLTIDEVVLSGQRKDWSDQNLTYLSGYNYTATMTPIFYGSIGNFYFENGYIGSEDMDANFKISPSISLKNSLKYVTGNGTVDKPYVIE